MKYQLIKYILTKQQSSSVLVLRGRTTNIELNDLYT